ncbi:DUF805 domain-containing protein [Sulfitobacter sp. HNIBRBA2951]|uniref:DUF805 domain-containing protein n=1 Tax=Sulfitobacter aquimarinus TaxID=3158557 RepID=UPI0032DEAEF9
MGPVNAISTVFAKTFTFKGRAGRSEYWWFFLLYIIGSIIFALLDLRTIVAFAQDQGEQAIFSLSPFNLLSPWFFIVMAIPYFSLAIRRLHDSGFSGFWVILSFVPLGAIALLILHAMPSQNSTTIHGSPAARPVVDPSGKPLTEDRHKRAMQGYALLFDKDKTPTPAQQAQRKAEISDYYRSKVLKSAPSA